MSLAVDHENQVSTAVATGSITMADVREHLDQEHEEGGLGYPEIIDATEATAAAMDSDDVRATVSILRELGTREALGPTAVLVSNDVTYGMTRALETLADDVCDVRPFRAGDRSAAEAWVASTPARAPGPPHGPGVKEQP
jgi:hypothetical protein